MERLRGGGGTHDGKIVNSTAPPHLAPPTLPSSRPELLPDSLASPSPNTLWTRKQRHPSTAGVENPSFVVRVSQSRSPGLGSIFPLKVCLEQQGAEAGFPPLPNPRTSGPGSFRTEGQQQGEACPVSSPSRTPYPKGPGTLPVQPGKRLHLHPTPWTGMSLPTSGCSFSISAIRTGASGRQSG